MEALPCDVIIVIVKHARCGTHADLRTLRSISRTCWALNRALRGRHKEVIDHYTVRIDDYGDVCYKLYELFHSKDDLPAITRFYGTQIWYRMGSIHRDGDRPAIIYASGEKEWYQHGRKHRGNDLPAVIYPSGTQEWFQHGYRHRDGDLPAMITLDGTMYYYKNNKIHRDDNKPAVISICAGYVEYWVNGKRIR